MEKMTARTLHLLAYDLAESCLADNLEVSDAVDGYLALHPQEAAHIDARKLRDRVYDIMTEFAMDD